MNCGDIGPLLSAYYDGEATAEERKLVEDCLASSPEAREQLQDYRRITGEFQSIGQPTPPADLRRSVMNRVHQMSGATARSARADTNRYNSAERTATGSIRRPLRVGEVVGQGFRFGALAAALVALLVVFTIVFAQLHRSQTAGIGPPEETQTAVAQVIATATPTTLPTDTPAAPLVTSTPQSITPPPTSTPGGPTDTPAQTVVADNQPTTQPASSTTGPGGNATHIAAAPTDTLPSALPPSDTPVPASPTNEPATATVAPPTATMPVPTATSVPPTNTSVLPTSTPAPTYTPVASPTAACAFSVIRGFGTIYNEHSDVSTALGCAVNSEIGMSGTVLSFQYGTMIWDSDHRLIYVLFNQGLHVEMYNETWDASDGEPSPIVNAPDGTHIPLRGFGKVWYEHQMWGTLGFATQEYETPVSEALQAFEHGRMLWTSQKLIYVMVGKLSTSANPVASQFSGTWKLYQDTFVDKGQAVPTPIGAVNPDGSLTVTFDQPASVKQSGGGQLEQALRVGDIHP